MARNEMTPQEAVVVLRMIDGVLMIGTMTSVEIDKGGNDD